MVARIGATTYRGETHSLGDTTRGEAMDCECGGFDIEPERNGDMFFQRGYG